MRTFASDARVGRFAIVTPPGALPICGLCGHRSPSSRAKAAHLREDHGAIIEERGGLFCWTRPLVGHGSR